MSDPLRVANEIKATILEPPVQKGEGGAGPGARFAMLSELAPVSGFLGVHNPTGSQGDQLRYINEFFTDGEKSVDAGELLKRIRTTERKLAPPSLGETRVGKLYAYVKALNAARSSKKAAEAYEG